MAEIFYIAGPAKKRIAGFQVDANSAPVYDGWGWGDYWSCADWKTWHQKMVTSFGAVTATQIWSQAWAQQTIDMNPFHFCRVDADFVNYFKQYGITFDPVTGIIVSISNVLNNAGNIVTNLGEGASFITGLIKPVSIVLLAAAAYYGYKHYLK